MSKENYHTLRYGNKDGEIKFGHIHPDDVISSAIIRSGKDYRHYISLDGEGTRSGWTLNRCPGVYQIRCADDVDETNIGFILEAVKGDIVIKASDGNVRIEGNNVFIKADGHDNKNGVVTIEGESAVEINSKNIEINGSATARFFCSGTTEVVGNAILNIYGGLAACATGSSSLKKSKYDSDPEKYNEESQFGE
jgi:hypothetical protein